MANLKLSDYVYNLSVSVDKEGLCFGNCPGCDLSSKVLKLSPKCHSKNEILNRVNYFRKEILPQLNEAGKKFYLIFHPAETLFQLDIDKIVEILITTSDNFLVQLEFLSLNKKILNLLENKQVQKLIKEKKLLLNIAFENNKLFKEIVNRFTFIAKQTEAFKNLQDKEESLVIDSINPNSPLLLSINSTKGFEEQIKNFLQKKGVKNIIYNGKGKFIIRGLKASSLAIPGDKFAFINEGKFFIVVHTTANQKIDEYGNNIWDVKHIQGKARCLLFDTFELSIYGDETGKIVPHVNPCINHVQLGTKGDSLDKIEENLQQHFERVYRLMVKYWLKKGFNQSQLCKMCKEGIDVEISENEEFRYWFLRKFDRFTNIAILQKIFNGLWEIFGNDKVR